MSKKLKDTKLSISNERISMFDKHLSQMLPSMVSEEPNVADQIANLTKTVLVLNERLERLERIEKANKRKLKLIKDLKKKSQK